ncbi:unnamed protein product [Parajaminaea phylloscopi]
MNNAHFAQAQEALILANGGPPLINTIDDLMTTTLQLARITLALAQKRVADADADAEPLRPPLRAMSCLINRTWAGNLQYDSRKRAWTSRAQAFLAPATMGTPQARRLAATASTTSKPAKASRNRRPPAKSPRRAKSSKGKQGAHEQGLDSHKETAFQVALTLLVDGLKLLHISLQRLNALCDLFITAASFQLDMHERPWADREEQAVERILSASTVAP